MLHRRFFRRIHLPPAFRRFPHLRFHVLLSLMLLFLIPALIFANNRISGAIEVLAEEKARAEVITRINRCIDAVSPEEFLNLSYDSEKRITAISVNSNALMRYKVAVLSALQSDLDQSKKIRISVPFGSLTGIPLAAGKGPNISVLLVPSGSVSAELESSFSDAGLNQTCHRILLHVSVDVTVLLPNGSEKYTVSSTECVSETVIVGEVPKVTGYRYPISD